MKLSSVLAIPKILLSPKRVRFQIKYPARDNLIHYMKPTIFYDKSKRWNSFCQMLDILPIYLGIPAIFAAKQKKKIEYI